MLQEYNGFSIDTIAHQMGHAQPSTTINIYAHVIAAAEARSAHTFDRFNDIVVPEPNESDASEKKVSGK